jgi:secondary thiamine-phosphate synthase enzyme
MYHAETLIIPTPGRGFSDLTRDIQRIVARSGIARGLATVFVHHTSASLLICENADPSVRRDLQMVFDRLAPDGDPDYRHDDEGPDDMSAHVRTALTATNVCIPVEGSRCDLGTWQGVYLWEHRTSPHQRRVTVSVVG